MKFHLLSGGRGENGIEDVRKVLIEAQCNDNQSYCNAIAREGPDHLKHLYGPVGYSIIDNVKKLPLMLSDIYRKLTTWRVLSCSLVGY